jgi:hypothetical protein
VATSSDFARAPTPAFASAPLEIREVEAGAEFGRIGNVKFPDPLGFGKTPSRFSDPRIDLPDTARFGVLYLGATIEACFVETVVRDRRDGRHGNIVLHEAYLGERYYARVRVRSHLRVLDMTSGFPLRMGIPTDVRSAADHTLARQWALAIHAHPANVDGIAYPSRLNAELDLAVFDRAVEKFTVESVEMLRERSEIGKLLDFYRIALI